MLYVLFKLQLKPIYNKLGSTHKMLISIFTTSTLAGTISIPSQLIRPLPIVVKKIQLAPSAASFTNSHCVAKSSCWLCKYCDWACGTFNVRLIGVRQCTLIFFIIIFCIENVFNIFYFAIIYIIELIRDRKKTYQLYSALSLPPRLRRPLHR
jgi:hypothetical protein